MLPVSFRDSEVPDALVGAMVGASEDKTGTDSTDDVGTENCGAPDRTPGNVVGGNVIGDWVVGANVCGGEVEGAADVVWWDGDGDGDDVGICVIMTTLGDDGEVVGEGDGTWVSAADVPVSIVGIVGDDVHEGHHSVHIWLPPVHMPFCRQRDKSMELGGFATRGLVGAVAIIPKT